MFVDKVFTAIFGTQNDRFVKALRPILESVNAKEEWAKSLKAEEYIYDEKTKNVTLTDDNEIKIYPKTPAENVSYTHSRKPTLRNVKQFLDGMQRINYQ